MDSFREYPSLPSEESNTDPDMEETKATGGNHLLTEFQIIIQKMEKIELELQTVKKISIVKAMLEQNKKIDGEQQYMEHLNEVVATGRATLSMYTKISETGASVKMRILNFVGSAPKYSENLEKVFKWCESLESHL